MVIKLLCTRVSRGLRQADAVAQQVPEDRAAAVQLVELVEDQRHDGPHLLGKTMKNLLDRRRTRPRNAASVRRAAAPPAKSGAAARKKVAKGARR